MRLDAVHIRPVHTVQVTDTNRKARYRNVKREIILHRKLIMERTESHNPVRTALGNNRVRLYALRRAHRQTVSPPDNGA